MNSLAQFILVVVIVTLTFLIAFVAVQVIQVLFEARQVLKRINKIIPDTKSTPMNQIMSEIKEIVSESEQEIVRKTAQKIQSHVESKKNVFRRSGLPLRPS